MIYLEGPPRDRTHRNRWCRRAALPFGLAVMWCSLPALPNKCPSAGNREQVACGCQLFIGGDSDESRDAELAGQQPRCRQSRTALQAAALDHFSNGAGKLLGKRTRRGAVNLNRRERAHAEMFGHPTKLYERIVAD